MIKIVIFQKKKIVIWYFFHITHPYTRDLSFGAKHWNYFVFQRSKYHSFMCLTDLLMTNLVTKTVPLCNLLITYLTTCLTIKKGLWTPMEFDLWAWRKHLAAAICLNMREARDDLDQTVDSQEWADKNFMAGRPMWSGWRGVLCALVQGTGT